MTQGRGKTMEKEARTVCSTWTFPAFCEFLLRQWPLSAAFVEPVSKTELCFTYQMSIKG